MKIEALGHSAFIATIERENRSPLRLLADPWLDDHVIGDVGGRFPRVRADWSQLGPIDAVWISHSHTDHLCPYSLLQLHQQLDPAPQLLIPSSLSYLRGLFEQFLPSWPLTIIEQETPVDLGGVRARAFFNLRDQATNEDDCMILLLDNGQDAILSEADAVLPMEDPAVRELVGELLIEAGPRQRIFVTTRNELEATMASIDAPDQQARQQVVLEQRLLTTQLAEAEIVPNGSDTCPWMTEGTVRIVIGQGITLPHEVAGEWNRVLFPIRLEDRVRIEQQAASREQLPVQIFSLLGGESLTVVDGIASPIDTIEGLEVLDTESQRHFDEDAEIHAEFPVAPLRDDSREFSSQHSQVLHFLQRRYLPYLVGQRQPAIEHRLSQNNGQYRIRVRYGTTEKWSPRDYVIQFSSIRFDEQPVAGEAQEEYWANDLDDYFQGTADDFSTFCRSFPGGTSHEFWDCLGMPFLNDDLVAKKIRYHFEQASLGHSAGDFVVPLWNFARQT
ncbi:MAG: hypothetical protein OSB09_08980 [Planctomycetota bacterium]|nr:hypothetical protein [Planctomycetota bacterium]